MRKLARFLTICICVVLYSCHSSEKLVLNPEGWEVSAFECTYITGGNQERLYIDGETFEHEREGQVRGRRMRVSIKGTPHNASMQITWISPTGQEHSDTPTPMDGSRAQRLFQEYRNNYFVSSKFPSEKSVENLLNQKYGQRKQSVSLCNRRSYQFIRGQQVVVVDARMGIQLAVYQTTAAGVQQTTKQLLYARWELQRGRERGYYEIRCSERR